MSHEDTREPIQPPKPPKGFDLSYLRSLVSVPDNVFYQENKPTPKPAEGQDNVL